MTSEPTTLKGQQRRHEIVMTAAEILHEQGPAGVTMRSVAARVGCSLSAMTYYFTNADELLGEAGRVNIAEWAGRAERVAEYAETHEPPRDRGARIDLLLKATLPEGQPLLGHYLQLVAAGQSLPVSTAYRTGRSRLTLAVGRVLEVIGTPIPADLAIAVVDGAAVSALSEGRDVVETSRARVAELLQLAHPGP